MASAYRLYEVLELLGPTATQPQIKAAYRRLSAMYHPDKVPGMENKFQEVQHAYKVLSDPDRRDRYDRTGRDDDIKVTPKVVQNMVEQTVLAVISAETPDGREPDDPTWENIKDKIVRSIQTTRREVTANLKRANKQLARLEKMAKRFKSKTDADPVGDAFAVHRARLTAEVHKYQDGLELSHKTEEAFASYDYLTGEVDPEPEGQFSPESTRRLSGRRYLSDLR